MRGIYIYDAQTLFEKKYIPTDDSVNCVAFSPDGKTIASTFRKGSVRLWQVSSGALIDILENDTGYPSGSLLFSSDGSLLFSAANDGAIRTWQTSDGKLIRTFRGNREYVVDEMVDSMSISPDGFLLATTDGYERVWIWRIATGEVVHRLEGRHVAFSPDGKVLAVGKGDYVEGSVVMFWQVSDWTLLNTLDTEKWRFINMVFAPDGETLLVNADEGEVQLWDLSKQPVFTCFHCGENYFEVLSFSPDGAKITTLDQDGVLQVWNMPNGDLLHTFDEHPGMVAGLEFSPDGNLLAAGSAPTVGIWRISDSTLLNLSSFKNFYSRYQSLAFSPDGRLLAFGPPGGGLRLREIEDPNPKLVLNDGQSIYAMAFSPDGTTLAVSFGFEQTIEFRRASDGMLLDTLVLTDPGGLNNLVYSPDSNLLAISRYDNIEIWDLSNKTLVHSLKGINFISGQVVFLPDGNILATGGTTAFWSGTDGKLLQSYYVRGDAFSPDTNLILTRQGTKVHFFRTSNGKLIRTLRFNTHVPDATFSMDGKLVAFGGDDGTIRIWGIP
jgi:WD40 repeat protein